jgi:hypothetical protein
MLSDDELDLMLRNSDPVRDGGAHDGRGHDGRGHDGRALDGRVAGPDSPAALRILARVRRSTRRRRRRVLVLAPVVALSVAGVTAGTYAWVAGDGHGHTLESTNLSCRADSAHDAVTNFHPSTDDPVRSCRQLWQAVFGVPAPTALTPCVGGSVQATIVVYPGGRDVCARHRSDPYAGPTQEQLRFDRFRTDIKAHFVGRTCVSYAEFKKVTVALLAENDLTGWTTRDFQTAEKEPEGPCAEVGLYDEPGRTVFVGNHEPGTPMQDWP